MVYYPNKFLLLLGVNNSMFNDKKVICLILARGGSKGVPHKNTKILGDKPLIGHSIISAQNSKYVDEIFVSTEDAEIKQISLDYNVHVIDRPENLAKDDTEYISVVKHLIKKIPSSFQNSVVLLLETTLPLRKIGVIDNCIELLDDSIDCVASISKVKIPPDYMFKIKDNLLEPYTSFENLTNRQKMNVLYSYNGSILVTTMNFIKKQQNLVFGGKIKGYILDEKKFDRYRQFV